MTTCDDWSDKHPLTHSYPSFISYATVRKEPPPRPPAPQRQPRGSSRSLSGGSASTAPAGKFATMPHRLQQRTDDASTAATLPERPTRNYHTIGPSRPPRRTSSFSLGETKR